MYTAAAALGLGTSLFYIHIYVTPLKRFVQVSRHCTRHNTLERKVCVFELIYTYVPQAFVA